MIATHALGASFATPDAQGQCPEGFYWGTGCSGGVPSCMPNASSACLPPAKSGVTPTTPTPYAPGPMPGTSTPSVGATITSGATDLLVAGLPIYPYITAAVAGGGVVALVKKRPILGLAMLIGGGVGLYYSLVLKALTGLHY